MMTADFEIQLPNKKSIWVQVDAKAIDLYNIDGLELSFYDLDTMGNIMLDYDKELFERLEDLSHQVLLDKYTGDSWR